MEGVTMKKYYIIDEYCDIQSQGFTNRTDAERELFYWLLYHKGIKAKVKFVEF